MMISAYCCLLTLLFMSGCKMVPAVEPVAGAPAASPASFSTYASASATVDPSVEMPFVAGLDSDVCPLSSGTFAPSMELSTTPVLPDLDATSSSKTELVTFDVALDIDDSDFVVPRLYHDQEPSSMFAGPGLCTPWRDELWAKALVPSINNSSVANSTSAYHQVHQFSSNSNIRKPATIGSSSKNNSVGVSLAVAPPRHDARNNSLLRVITRYFQFIRSKAMEHFIQNVIPVVTAVHGSYSLARPHIQNFLHQPQHKPAVCLAIVVIPTVAIFLDWGSMYNFVVGCTQAVGNAIMVEPTQYIYNQIQTGFNVARAELERNQGQFRPSIQGCLALTTNFANWLWQDGYILNVQTAIQRHVAIIQQYLSQTHLLHHDNINRIANILENTRLVGMQIWNHAQTEATNLLATAQVSLNHGRDWASARGNDAWNAVSQPLHAGIAVILTINIGLLYVIISGLVVFGLIALLILNFPFAMGNPPPAAGHGGHDGGGGTGGGGTGGGGAGDDDSEDDDSEDDDSEDDDSDGDDGKPRPFRARLHGPGRDHVVRSAFYAFGTSRPAQHSTSATQPMGASVHHGANNSTQPVQRPAPTTTNNTASTPGVPTLASAPPTTTNNTAPTPGVPTFASAPPTTTNNTAPTPGVPTFASAPPTTNNTTGPTTSLNDDMTSANKRKRDLESDSDDEMVLDDNGDVVDDGDASAKKLRTVKERSASEDTSESEDSSTEGDESGGSKRKAEDASISEEESTNKRAKKSDNVEESEEEKKLPASNTQSTASRANQPEESESEDDDDDDEEEEDDKTAGEERPAVARATAPAVARATTPTSTPRPRTTTVSTRSTPGVAPQRLEFQTPQASSTSSSTGTPRTPRSTELDRLGTWRHYRDPKLTDKRFDFQPRR